MNATTNFNLGQCRTKYFLNRSKPNSKPQTPAHSIISPPIESLNPNTQKKNDQNMVMTSYSRKNSQGSFQSHHPHDSNQNPNSEESNLLCQSCINQCLAYQRRDKYKEDNSIPTPAFEDKNRGYTQKFINNIVKGREMQSIQAGEALMRLKNAQKDTFINERENDINPFNKVNSDYIYERAKKNQNEKEKINAQYMRKYNNGDRPEIASYFEHYINNDKCQGPVYGEYKPNSKEIYLNYQKELLDQIDYKRNLQREMNEKEEKEAREQYEKIQKQIENEENERMIQKQRAQQQLRYDNLSLIKERELRKIKEDDEKKAEGIRYMKQDQIEKEKEQKRNYNALLEKQRLLQDNLEDMRRERNLRLKRKEEDENYNYKDNICAHGPEAMGTCMRCHRQFPRRLLSVNQNFYTNKRK